MVIAEKNATQKEMFVNIRLEAIVRVGLFFSDFIDSLNEFDFFILTHALVHIFKLNILKAR